MSAPTWSSEPIRFIKADDADFPEVMQYVPDKSRYTIAQIGDVLFVPLYQVIDKMQEPKCIDCYLDEETGNFIRECEEW